MALNKDSKIIIGKSDVADLPTFNLENVKVKIDSGAYTSTIHCSVITETENGLEVVFLDNSEGGFTGEKMIFKDYKQRKVRSSNGKLEVRFSVKGSILLFEKKYFTEFTLSKRNLMRYPILLGRKLLSNHFLIDTTKTNLSYKQKIKKT
ncbi:MAG TPA: RimK/LysX family protein [Brumimicrobium sp.]|nr:RimK/LysX family protein [Brumimicrobium sp.]